MLVRDEDARQLQTAAEKTDIAKKLKKKPASAGMR